MARNSKENKGKKYGLEDENFEANERGYQPTRGYQPESGIDRKNPPGKKKDNSTAGTDNNQTGDTENK
ncbi:MAG TPA: hypothetical protein VK186_18500 [Candidatus Deferrimicrobium sp.]|nr:hypothetical protein [Candidatus Deferrimicrobium sp.]